MSISTDQDVDVITTDNATDKKSASADERAVKTWHRDLAANADAAVQFVNAPPAQGAGEASFSMRDNGQVWCFTFRP